MLLGFQSPREMPSPRHTHLYTPALQMSGYSKKKKVMPCFALSVQWHVSALPPFDSLHPILKLAELESVSGNWTWSQGSVLHQKNRTPHPAKGPQSENTSPSPENAWRVRVVAGVKRGCVTSRTATTPTCCGELPGPRATIFLSSWVAS